MKLDVKTQKKAKVGFYEVNFYNFKEKVKQRLRRAVPANVLEMNDY